MRGWRRLEVAGLALALVLAGRTAVGTLISWADYGIHHLYRTDFALYYASSLQGLRYGWSHLYDVADQHRVMATMGGRLLFFPNPYTPIMSWLVVPFTRLSLSPAYAIWSLIIGAGLVITWWLIAPGRSLLKLVLLAAVLCPYVVVLGLLLGQVNTLQMACLALSVWLLRRGHDSWAGLPLVTIAVHPQGIDLVPLALLVAGRWRTVGVWAAATVAIAIAVVLKLGADGALAYAHRLIFAEGHPDTFWVGPWYTLPLQVHAGHRRMAVEGAVVLATAFLAWRHRRSGPELPIAAGLLGSVLSSPFIHLQDHMWVFPAAWLVLSTRPPVWQWALLAAGFLITLQNTNLGAPKWGGYLLLFEVVWFATLVVLKPAPAVAEREPVEAPGEAAQDVGARATT